MSNRPIELPFSMSSELSAAQKRRIEAEALLANDRYVLDVLEEHSLCPYAKAGRERGLTERYVHFCEAADATAVAQLFELAAPREVQVLQIIFPLVSVEAAPFARFVNEITEVLNQRCAQPVFAGAALHPELSYRTDSATGLISLFRRAPDPTLQWVRLSTLDSIYKGRKSGTNFVDLANLAHFLTAPAKRDLYGEIARANQETAERLGIAALDEKLSELHQQTQLAYREVVANG